MADILEWQPWAQAPDLLAPTVAAALAGWALGGDVRVAEIDPDLADTAEFCARYGVGIEQSANCVVVAGRRGEVTRYAGCLVLATTRADVNGVVRRRLDARKASFAPLADTVAASGMEYGGITPLGLPGGWPVYVDAAVAAAPWIVIGSGVRRSKLSLPGAAIAVAPNAEVIAALAIPGPT